MRSTSYSYIGAVIGFLNAGLLMPKLLSTDEIGVIGLIVSIFLVFSQLSSLGFGHVLNRLFPYFRNPDDNRYQFFTIGMLVSVAGSFFSVVVYFLIRHWFNDGTANQDLYDTYEYYILPLTIITIFLNYFDNYYRMLFNATIGVFLKEIITKVFISVGILFYYLGFIQFFGFVLIYFAAYSLPTFVLAFGLLYRGEFKLRWPRKYYIKRLKWAFISLSVFGVIIGFSNVAVSNFDRMMLKSFETLAVIGVYTTGFNFATLILMPARSMKRIASVVLAESWRNRDLPNIATILEKSSITQFISGIYLFLGLWLNVDNIIAMLGPNYEGVRLVILFIGLSNLTEMLSGVSMSVISTSKKYVYAAYFMVLLLSLVVISNLIFIPMLGIAGAALATWISMLIVVVARLIFIWSNYKIQPFSVKHIKILLIMGLTYLIVILVPSVSNFIIDVLIKGTLISIIFIPGIYFSKVSVDINLKLEQILSIVIKKIRK
ncbi:MAG: polysaccharide biosynthesis C-terminal domain-containing protein [Bacteroidales bacterium]|nr:polysaccharide biosynthesis C-terminal domain-containing protein [Bacteroidales bacterium]